MRELTGGCLCGQVRYSANADPAFVGVCHCKHCQKQTGTAFSVIVGIPKSALSVQGQLKAYHDTGESGQTVDRNFIQNAVRPSSQMPRQCRASRSSRLERSTTRAGWIPKCISIATARSSGLSCRKGARCLPGGLASPAAAPAGAGRGENFRLASAEVDQQAGRSLHFGRTAPLRRPPRQRPQSAP